MMPPDSPPPIDPEVDPRLRKLFQQLDPGPRVPEGMERDVALRSHAAWEALTARSVDATATSPSYKTRRAHMNVKTSRSWRMIATVCVVFAIGIGAWMAWPTSSPVSSTRAFATKPGQQMTVRLANDVRVTLAPATTLRVDAERMLLDGEAYFDVTPHSRRAVTIRTSHAEVRVLGTRFGVRGYPGERASRVVVENGKVALRVWRSANTHLTDTSPASARSAIASSTIVTAGTLAMVSDSGVVVTPGIVVSGYLGWTQGQLSFDGAPLGDVIADLARAYGANIRIQDSVLARRSLTMAVEVRSKPLGLVLELVGRAAGARVTREGNAYVLVPGRASTPDARLHRFPEPETHYGK